MTILVQNLTNETKQICRFGGTRLYVLPNNFVTFECTNTQEVSYWSKQSIKDLSSVGLRVIIDPNTIASLLKFRNVSKKTFAKITDSVKKVETTTITSNDNATNIETVKIIETDIPTAVENIVEVSSTIEETVDNVESVVENEVIVEDVENSVETETTVEDITKIETPAETDTVLAVEATTETEGTVEAEEPTETNDSTEVEYTEEYLSTLSKADLQEICLNNDIPFKKNNSVSTLINLILNA